MINSNATGIGCWCGGVWIVDDSRYKASKWPAVAGSEIWCGTWYFFSGCDCFNAECDNAIEHAMKGDLCESGDWSGLRPSQGRSHPAFGTAPFQLPLKIIIGNKYVDAYVTIHGNNIIKGPDGVTPWTLWAEETRNKEDPWSQGLPSKEDPWKKRKLFKQCP